MISHYLTWFCVATQGKQLAACGAWIDAPQASTEPTCPACQRYLNGDAIAAPERNAS